MSPDPKKGLLLDQRHSAEDDYAFFRDIDPALRDRRYITIGGRPVLAIYRPRLFPDMHATLDRWRECCRKAGINEPYMVMMQTSFEGQVNPKKFGFDAAIEFPPHNLDISNVSRRVNLYDPGAEVGVYDYEHVVDRALFLEEPDYKLFRGVMPEWDCTPRRANPGLFINCGPHRYQRWLEGLCVKTDLESDGAADEKLIFINAWNEWAEGAYLEPDRKYGYGYLDATARALNAYRPTSIDPLGLRVLVVAHIFYMDLLDEFIEHFCNIPCEFDLFLTVPNDQRDFLARYTREHAIPKVKKTTVVSVENFGADIGPFILHGLPYAMDYDICVKVHTKKTPYNSKFAGWRQFLLRNLLGYPQNIAAIAEAFAREPKLGVLYPKPFGPVAEHAEWGSNFNLTASLLEKLRVSVSPHEQPKFPTGSMFWFRPKALQPLLDLALTDDDFKRWVDGARDAETGAIVDGTLMHALERTICYVAAAAGYDCRDFLFER
jgi:Glycosyltransferase WbsX/Rhamnan synthesis protein F